MPENLDSPLIRLARAEDAMRITLLYQQVYEGHYANPLMRDPRKLAVFLENPAHLWIVAEINGRICGSVVFELDAPHRLCRCFGAAVKPAFRGHGILEEAVVYGQQRLFNQQRQADVIYGMTRTSTPAPQVVAEKLGFKKLGIFPNIRRAEQFETHCLTAIFADGALQKRFTDFKIHPSICRLFDLVAHECDLPPQPIANADDIVLPPYDKVPELELIHAEKYVLHRFQTQEQQNLLQSHFYPFHAPNVVLSSPDQSVEMFVYLSASETYCTIMGMKKPQEINFTCMLEQCTKLLHKIGVRYIELMIRADNLEDIERVLQARFIPSAYFPAFQLHAGKRHDFVIFSRTFEVLDFHNVRLSGLNMVYLEEYMHNLQRYFLQPNLATIRQPQQG